MATIKEARHYVALGFRGEVEKEEAFLEIEADTGKTSRTVIVACDRYRTSDGNLTDWRWYIRDIEPAAGIGPAKRELIRAGIAPLVTGWFAGTFGTERSGLEGKYARSAEAAIARAVASEIRNMRTTADYRASAALTEQRGNMSGDDAARLDEAHAAMLKALTLTEG
jgi:hypothetical protein